MVAFLFHAMTSLLPQSFHRNDFSTLLLMDGEEVMGKVKEVGVFRA